MKLLIKHTYFLIGILLVASLLACPSLASAQTSLPPVRNTGFKAFNEKLISAQAAVVVDAATGELIYIYHPDWQWPLASVAKLMSALVFTEQQPNWNATVAMSTSDEVGGGRLRVALDTQITKRDLLYCSIVGSANNTAMAMMRTSNLTPEQFVARMNELGRQIGLSNTTFSEPSGMDLNNVSNALDVAKLGRYAFSQPTLQRVTQTSKYQFVVKSTGEVKTIKNTNKLLTDDNSVYVVGGKTGYLDEAQNNLVVQLRPMTQSKNRKGEVIVVVLGSKTKDKSFTDAKLLAQWVWRSHEWPQTPKVVIEAIERGAGGNY